MCGGRAWEPKAVSVASLAPPIPDDNLGVLGLPALSNLMISPHVSGAKQAIGDAGEALYRMKGGTEPCLQSGGPDPLSRKPSRTQSRIKPDSHSLDWFRFSKDSNIFYTKLSGLACMGNLSILKALHKHDLRKLSMFSWGAYIHFLPTSVVDELYPEQGPSPLSLPLALH